MQPFKKRNFNEIDKSKVEKVCIDDFALKKGYNYATVMVDIDTRKIIDLIETRKIIDLIETRNSNEVSTWLKTFPNLKIISRDGSIEYKKAITTAHPNSVQISDRFHLLKNLTTYLKDFIKRSFKTTIELGQIEITQYTNKLNLKVKELYRKSYSQRAIAQQLNISRSTVKKYISCDEILDLMQVKRNKKSILDPYREDLLKMYSDNFNCRCMYDNIKIKGYTGSYENVRHYIRSVRTEIMTGDIRTDIDFVYRKDVISLLYKEIYMIKDLTTIHFNKLIDTHCELRTIFEVLTKFKFILKNQDSSTLDNWIEYVKGLNIKELNSFIAGIERDKIAVENAISYTYSNGLAEGKINKIKVIKRIMYGRCSFNTLKNKILELER